MDMHGLETKLMIGWNAASAVGGAVAGFAFGGWSGMLTSLLILVAADYLTGMIASHLEGNLSSKVGFKGLLKKSMIFILVAVAHQIDLTLETGGTIKYGVIGLFISNELLSITENAGRAGVPLPEPLVNAVKVLKIKASGKGDGGSGL